MNNILIGLSWPYANGELHIGHLGSSLPADILARYYRLKGNNVCFVSGSDCFGTPISIKAQLEKKKPQEIAEYYHQKFVEVFQKLDFTFDIYSKTCTEQHVEFAKAFHKEIYSTPYVFKKDEKRLYCECCNRFLPDRYVVGICPNCNNITKGDSCEKCGKILEPEELKNPQCGICGKEPTAKENFQYYLSLSKLQNQLENYFNKNKLNWSQNAVNLTERYINEGLLDRAISRDLDWGVAVPVENLKNKVVYNWGENVLGYISACKEFCETNNLNFSDWFKNENATHIYIHAKDNIPFHSIIYPALLIVNKQNYHLPDKILAYEYVTNNGQKISKSKGTCLTVNELLQTYSADYLRYYFAKNISDKKDLNFSQHDFIQTINGELVNNWGNFVNRTLSFIKNKFNGKIKKHTVNSEIRNLIKTTFNIVSEEIEKGKIANATRLIFELVDYANKFIDTTEPWKIFKTNNTACEELCYNFLTLIANIALLLNPIIPNSSARVLNWLHANPNVYDYFEIDYVDLNEFEVLYTRI